MRSPDQNVKSSNRVHSYILRLQIGQYVEHQTDNISKLVSVSSKLQLTIISSTLQLSTNQLYSHFSGIPEPRPRQTVPIPCLFSDSHGMLEPRPRQTAPIPVSFTFLWNHRTQTSPDSPYSMLTFLLLMECQNPGLARQPLFQSVSRFYLLYKNCSLSLCTSASQLMCEPCNVLQSGPRFDFPQRFLSFVSEPMQVVKSPLPSSSMDLCSASVSTIQSISFSSSL